MKSDKAISYISRIRDRANEVIAEQLAQRGVKGLVASHGDILFQLFQHGSLPMNQLALRIGRKKNTLTVLAQKLAGAGYVNLMKSSEDGRVTMVELTEKGKSFQGQFLEISRILLNKVWGDMPFEEREMLASGLEKILKNLRRE